MRSARDRYFGVLAPNSPLRAAVTALALAAATTPPAAPPNPPAAEPAHRRAARYAWALLLARIYDVFPLRCTHCDGAMRIIGFITDARTVRDILAHLGEPTAPPRIAPARAPPRWTAAGAEHDPIPDPAFPPTPAYVHAGRASRPPTRASPASRVDDWLDALGYQMRRWSNFLLTNHHRKDNVRR